MIKFRKIKPNEIVECARKFKAAYPWAGMPQWEGVTVREEDGRITAFFGLQQRIVVEPLWSESPRATMEIIPYIDGQLSAYKEYEFVIPNDNEKFQAALEKHYGIEGQVEPPHKIYFVRH